MNSYDVPRNDTAAAREWYEANKPIRPEDMTILLMAQDDPTELMQISVEWDIEDDQQRYGSE